MRKRFYANAENAIDYNQGIIKTKYKTVVYALAKGGIQVLTHRKQQISFRCVSP